MAYDLVVGKSFKLKDAPDIVGSITFDEVKIINSLAKKVDSQFLAKISNTFIDASFTSAEIKQAINELNPLLLLILTPDDRAMLHQLLAVLGYAHANQQCLFGVAD